MPKVTYFYTRTVGGVDVIRDLECTLECEVHSSADEDPYIEVVDVALGDGDIPLMDTKDPDAIDWLIAMDIAEKAAKDPDVIEEVTKAVGIYWYGRGVNDPEGYFQA